MNDVSKVFMNVFSSIRGYLRRSFVRGQNLARRYPKTAAAFGLLLLLWLFCLPRPLFDRPYSTVLEDRNGDLLGAHIAADGQWRFPQLDVVPDKYAACLIAFEDKRFWYHPGFDPVSLCRSVWQNVRGGAIVSGGSTITMQVIRMARNNPPRTVWQKIVEIFMATRLELGCSKSEILALYATNAPFGGNVVGLEAASWRYYGKRPELMTWAEAAVMAVLPNSPALIHPGRNRNALLEKRNRLLETLLQKGRISELECYLAKEEPLPEAPVPLPQMAPHLLAKYIPSGPWHTPKGKTRSTIDRAVQQILTEVLARRQALYRGNEVHNMAAIVIDVQSGEVLGYAGNVPGAGAAHGEQVDVLCAPRSTGSILKPYLYALALESGDAMPEGLLHDVPTQLGRYKPENFYESYDGAVSAKRALIRSLNVPFVLLLQQYGLDKFHFNLQRLGLQTLNKPPDHYGLSLILGGAEANLTDITNSYACMARVLGAFYERNGKYASDDFRRPVFANPGAARRSKARLEEAPLLSAGAIWHTFEAMREVERPNSSGEWELFQAGRRIAWKTGTSYGFRDAWSAGVTPQYAVGVWVGNADGEGRPGLIGVEMAAPVLFEIFDRLPDKGAAWFDPPYDDMAQMAVCRQSGYRAGEYCESDTLWAPKSALKAKTCVNHQLLHLDASGQWQVNSDCENPANMQHKPWFVLPALEEFYFKSKNPGYTPPPPLRSDCGLAAGDPRQSPMQLIYPKQLTQIYVPVDLDGQLSSAVFQAAHRRSDAEIFWHLDDQYIGSTRTFHQMALRPAVGPHQLTLVDKEGYRLVQSFEIIGKK